MSLSTQQKARLQQESNDTQDLLKSMPVAEQIKLFEATKRLIRDWDTLEQVSQLGYPIHETSVHFEDLNLVYCVTGQAKCFSELDQGYFTGYDNNNWQGNPGVLMAMMVSEIGVEGVKAIRKSGFKNGLKKSELKLLVPNY
jgi:hypothetical protein